MNSVWSSLLWKEWREHRAKLFTLLAVTLVFLPAPWVANDSREVLQNSMILFLLVMPAMSLFVGAGIAAGEHSRKTIGFLQALPIGSKKPAVAKLAFASAVAYAPTLLMMLVFVLWGWLLPDIRFFVMDWFFFAYLATMGLASVSLVIWMAAVGVNRSDEVRAGAIGLLVMLVYWAALAYLFPGSRAPWPLWHRVLTAAAPAGIANAVLQDELLGVSISTTYFLPFLLTAAISHAILAAIYIYRFGRVSTARTQVVEQPALERPTTAALRPPRRGPIRAIVWKQFRETAPLALLGAACIFCVAAILVAVILRGGGIGSRSDSARELLPMLVVTWMMISYLVAMFSGIGLFAEDLRPQIHGFWRSRPVSIGRWFSVKFASALAITLVVLTLPMAIILGGFVSKYGVNSVLAEGPTRPLAAMGINVATLAASFTVAAAATSWFRRPVAAAIASIVATFVAVRCFDQYASGYQETFLALIFATGFAIWLAWYAIRRDLSLNAH